MEANPSRSIPEAWVWLFPPVYAIHLIDERLYGLGTADFATQYMGIWFTNEAWVWVNVPSMILMTVAAALVARRRWPEWVAVALATHFALHGLGRLTTSLWFWIIQPGLLSGLLLCVPLAGAVFLRARHTLSWPEIRSGLLFGVASFQPLWHFALLPFLPPPPS